MQLFMLCFCALLLPSSSSVPEWCGWSQGTLTSEQISLYLWILNAFFYSNSAVRMLFHPLAATARIKYVSFFWCQRNMGIESRTERSQVHVDERGCLASAQARSCFSGKTCFGPDKFCYLSRCSWGSTGLQACFSVHLNMCTCSALDGFTTWHLRATFTEAKSPDLLWDTVAIFISAT